MNILDKYISVNEKMIKKIMNALKNFYHTHSIYLNSLNIDNNFDSLQLLSIKKFYSEDTNYYGYGYYIEVFNDNYILTFRINEDATKIIYFVNYETRKNKDL